MPIKSLQSFFWVVVFHVLGVPGGFVLENSHWVEVTFSLLWTIANLELQYLGLWCFLTNFHPLKIPMIL